jgi:hypothetical protein
MHVDFDGLREALPAHEHLRFLIVRRQIRKRFEFVRGNGAADEEVQRDKQRGEARVERMS